MNVDGSFLGSSGRWGVRGLIRDSKGNILIQFRKEVNMDLVVHAEVLALNEGLIVAVASRWASIHSFVFKSDSQSILVLVVNLSSALWRLHSVLREYCYVLGSGLS